VHVIADEGRFDATEPATASEAAAPGSILRLQPTSLLLLPDAKTAATGIPAAANVDAFLQRIRTRVWFPAAF